MPPVKRNEAVTPVVRAIGEAEKVPFSVVLPVTVRVPPRAEALETVKAEVLA